MEFNSGFKGLKTEASGTGKMLWLIETEELTSLGEKSF